MKAFDCIREASFINSHTLEDLTARFDASREPHAFFVTYFLTALAASLKEPDVMNQVCFQELLNAEEAKEKDNADYKFVRFWNTKGTQMEELEHNSGLKELTCFESAVASFLYELREKEYQIDKVRMEVISRVHESCAALGENVPQLIRSSYVVFDKVLKMKMEGNVDDAKSVEELLESMQSTVAASVENDGIVSPAVLSQLSQIAHYTLVWLELILAKNKKCSKPMPAREPVAARVRSEE